MTHGFDVRTLSLREAFVSMTAMRLRTALLSASLLFAASPSLANGRFPLSQRLFQDQGNPDHFVVSATFGLLVSRDHGLNWYHVCEAALTSGVETADPLLELTPDGSMLSALVRPLRLSSDCGCAWQSVLGDGADQSMTDITKAGGNTLLALARSSGPPTVFRIERSSDGGRTWSKVSDLPQISRGVHVRCGAVEPDARVRLGHPESGRSDAGMPRYRYQRCSSRTTAAPPSARLALFRALRRTTNRTSQPFIPRTRTPSTCEPTPGL